MLSKTMQNAINEQIVAELYSSYLYLSMAAFFDSKSLKGAASWMKNQSQEEMVHTMKFYNFVNDRGGVVLLGAIKAPTTTWNSPLAVFEDVLAHEQWVTRLVNDLVDLAATEKDHASSSFLQWFVDEQVEEEATVSDVIGKLKMISGNDGLFMIDKELATRAFVYPPPALGG